MFVPVGVPQSDPYDVNLLQPQCRILLYHESVNLVMSTMINEFNHSSPFLRRNSGSQLVDSVQVQVYSKTHTRDNLLVMVYLLKVVSDIICVVNISN